MLPEGIKKGRRSLRPKNEHAGQRVETRVTPQGVQSGRRLLVVEAFFFVIVLFVVFVVVVLVLLIVVEVVFVV